MFFDFLCALVGRLLFFTGAIGGKGSFPKPLPPEEEAEYLRRARAGDASAKDALVRHNMRLVAHIVKKYNGAAETDDLISVGSIGLIKAIDTYKEGKGTQLATYTARCIENEILMLIRSNKKHKGNAYLSDPVGVDKEGNELTLMDLLFEKEEGVFKTVENRLGAGKIPAPVGGGTFRAGVHRFVPALRAEGRGAHAAKGGGGVFKDLPLVHFSH